MMEHTPLKRWNTGGLAFLGAFLGMGLAGAHWHWHLRADHSSAENPFLHLLLDLTAGMLGVAALFAGLSELRNWLVRGER